MNSNTTAVARSKSEGKSPTLPPIPPGEVLAEEFLAPLGVSQNALARNELQPRLKRHIRPFAAA